MMSCEWPQPPVQGCESSERSSVSLPPLVLLEVVESHDSVHNTAEADEAHSANATPQLFPLTAEVASRIPYVVSALSSEWRGDDKAEGCHSQTVRVYLPSGCSPALLGILLARLAAHSGVTSQEPGFSLHWRPMELPAVLRLVQVASMLQLEDLMPELGTLVLETIKSVEDLEYLQNACSSLQLPAAICEADFQARRARLEPAGLPDEAQVRGMIASALGTADGKVWRVVQKVIDRREAWPRLAAENANILLSFAKGKHGSIRAVPHTGFFWGSRDFLYLVCRFIRKRPSFFDAMVSAMFDSVYSMDPELPPEIIDAVFKELLVHEGLSFSQCEHVITKLMQREDQLEYLFHEWSPVFPTLPCNARRALSKGLLPAVGKCPHQALDFVLKELENQPYRPDTSLRACPRRADVTRTAYRWLESLGQALGLLR